MSHGKSELRGRQIHAEKPNMHRKATSFLVFLPIVEGDAIGSSHAHKFVGPRKDIV